MEIILAELAKFNLKEDNFKFGGNLIWQKNFFINFGRNLICRIFVKTAKFFSCQYHLLAHAHLDKICSFVKVRMR